MLLFAKTRAIAVIYIRTSRIVYITQTACYLLNHVILNDSQPCTINYLINLKEIIDFVFLVLSTSRLSFKKGNSEVFDL